MLVEQSQKILIVDDEPFICELIHRWLTHAGYSCKTAYSGEQALQMLQHDDFDLVVSDIMMPGMSGIDLLTIIKSLYPSVAVLMVTGVDDRKTAMMTLEMGSYGYVIKPFEQNEVIINVANALERNRLRKLSEQYEQALEATVEERTRQVREREEEIVLRLISALGFRHGETAAHVKRIGLYSEAMARALGWAAEAVAEIKQAAPMHDIGKIGIPDHILMKPEKLTPEEFEIMKTHTEIGRQILDGSNVHLLQMASEIAFCHHERWDGTGYPRGLVGEEIPESARIVAIVDVYDALINERVYRPALPENKALEIMIAGNGEYFGPEIFDCFMESLPIIRQIWISVRESEHNDASLHR